jgi:glycosyltransferase involved in cell wall biosynthesis
MPPDFGAVGEYTYHLANTFSEKGNRVKVLTFSKNSNDFKMDSSYSESIIYLNNKFSVSEIYRSVRNIQPDVFLIHLTPYSISRVGVPWLVTILILLLKWNKINVMIMYHETVLRYRSFSLRYIKNNLMAFIQQTHLLFLSSLCPSFTSNKDYARNLNRVRAVIPVASNILPISLSPEERLSNRNAMLVKKEKFILTTFGSNLRDTLRYIDILSESNLADRVLFLVIGKIKQSDVDKVNAINKKGKLRIILTGYVTDKEVSRYLSIADLFLMFFPMIDKVRSGINTKSGSLAAAFAHGLPVVSQRGIMTDDVFVHLENCYLLTGENMSEYIMELSNLLENNTLLLKLSKNSRNFYKSHLDWEKVAQSFLNHFTE